MVDAMENRETVMYTLRNKRDCVSVCLSVWLSEWVSVCASVWVCVCVCVCACVFWREIKKVKKASRFASWSHQSATRYTEAGGALGNVISKNMKKKNLKRASKTVRNMDGNLLKTLKEQESQSCEETDGESHKKKYTLK